MSDEDFTAEVVKQFQSALAKMPKPESQGQLGILLMESLDVYLSCACRIAKISPDADIKKLAESIVKITQSWTDAYRSN